jgi:hypothetical protein
MKFDKLNEWLSVAANIGVVIGIIFLALEIRFARDSINLQLLNASTGGYQSINEILLSNGGAAGALAKGLYNPNTLTDAEVVQFSMFLLMFQNNARNLRELWLDDQIAEEDFRYAVRQYASLLNTPGGRLFRENWPGFETSGVAEDIAPYEDAPPMLNFILDRIPEEIGVN